MYGIAEFIEIGVNWISREGFRTNREIAVESTLKEFHRIGVEETQKAAVEQLCR